MKRDIAYVCALSALLTIVGCQAPLKPVFPEVSPPVAWPRPPDQARIGYIGQLVGEESLGAQPKGLEVLGQLFTGPKAKVGFSTPTAVIPRGDLVYVADGQGGAVYVMNLTDRSFGAIRQAAGRNLEWPIDLAFVGDELAVVDSRRASVFLYDAAGHHRRSIGEGQLKRPGSIAVDARTGDLWVVDSGAHDCKVFSRDGRLKAQVGRRGTGSAEFNYPVGIACHADGTMIIADSMNFRVQLLTREGSPVSAFGSKGDAAGDFALPRDVATDSRGHIYVLDNQFENFQVFDKQGRLLMSLGQEGRGPGEFYLPSGITIDGEDRIWVADTYNRRVQVFRFLKETEP
jgi:DNA-binding beta-propeller fold protein YncE